MGALSLVARSEIRRRRPALLALALLIGVSGPLGVIAGRLAWARVAGDIGVAADLAAPILWVAIAVAASTVAALLVALLPGWLGTRRPPAEMLRTE